MPKWFSRIFGKGSKSIHDGAISILSEASDIADELMMGSNVFSTRTKIKKLKDDGKDDILYILYKSLFERCRAEQYHVVNAVFEELPPKYPSWHFESILL